MFDQFQRYIYFGIAVATLAGAVIATPAGADDMAMHGGSIMAPKDVVTLSSMGEVLRLKALEVPGCYGRGHDIIFHHLREDQTAAMQALRGCFKENVKTEFYFFGNPEPVRLTDLWGLVGFIENFAITTGYHTARNMPSNAAVELTGRSTATLTSSGATPHFSLAPTNGGVAFADLVSARYTHDLEIGADGVWRTTHFVIHIEEILRTQGSFPFGQ